MSPATTRRGALALLLSTPAAAQALPGAISDSPFRRAVAALQKADAQRDGFYENVFEPAWERRSAAETRIERLVKALPHHRTTNSFENILNERKTLTTSDEVSVQVARNVLANPPRYTDEDGDYLATIRELVAAADERDAKAAEIRSANPLPPVPDEDTYATERWEALEAVISAPVRDYVEFVEKFAILRDWGCFETDGDRAERSSNAILRDVASLTGAA